MRPTFTASIAGVFLFASTSVFAQAISEYSRAIGTVAPKGSTAPVSGKANSQTGKNSKAVVQGVGSGETRSIPLTVAVRSKEAFLYARSDELAETIAPVAVGEKLTPMLEAAGVNSLWYMVKTEAGVVGWVKSSDLESVSTIKP